MATSVEDHIDTTHSEGQIDTIHSEDQIDATHREDQTDTTHGEDQIDTTHAQDPLVSAPSENQVVEEAHQVAEEKEEAEEEGHVVNAPVVEEQIVETLVEEHHHTVSNPSEEDHAAPNQSEDHIQEDHMVSNQEEEDHTTEAANVEEGQIEEDNMVISHVEDQQIEDDHMVTAHIEHQQIEEDHHIVTTDVEEQMGSAHVHIEDEIGSAHLEDHMVHSNNDLVIMSTPDEDEKLLMTPYEDDSKMMTPYEAKTPSSYEINNNDNEEGANPETQPNKRRKKKSIVWEHFTIETVSAGVRRACCKQCKQTFAYSMGSKVAGTSHLKRHIAKGTCQEKTGLIPYTPASRSGGGGGNGTSEPPKRRYRTSNQTALPTVDADRCRHDIARMIIMHDYPLHMVEHPGFLTFIQNLQPQFNMVSFNTIQGDCVATYLMEKQNLLRSIETIPGRICLALDMWASSQWVGYVFVTGHFIDADWKLQKRLLNVVMEPYPNSDTALSHAVAVCLHDWGLENKLFSVTINQSLGEAAIEALRSQLAIKNPHILDGQLLVGNCIARTFCAIALDILEEGKEMVGKVRRSVMYVKTSDSHEEKFIELKQHLQVPSERILSIDDATQWNTTYQMLVAASDLKEVFSCLDSSDPDYKGAPSSDEWKQIETICSYLKLLLDTANILTTANAATKPNPITFFHEVWKIQTELSRAVASNEDPFGCSLAKRMLERIDQYWKSCSLALATAVVMDPRFKMKLVEFSFNKIYGDEAPAYIKIVGDGIRELFHEYVALPLPLTPTYAEEGNSGNIRSDENHGGSSSVDNGLTDFDMYIMETTSQQMKSELDQYLDESLLPRVQDFDVLGWWKLNKMKYPTLSKMARDILSIPVSTVSSDSVFRTTVKEMDSYRNSLRPETVEALICAKDWMPYGVSDASNAIVRMEY